nr:SRPBCC family protein [Paenibacillus soyae]
MGGFGVEASKPVLITVEAIVQAPVEKVWTLWTEPEHIKQWNKASDDWHTPHAENDLRAGGKFVSRMEAKDGSFGFDFGGVYDEVNEFESISYTMDDDRKVKISFIRQDDSTKVIESFEAEQSNAVEMQQAGWQAILDSFKNYAESV